ncbi:ribonuclease R [Parvularcula marina]|uniref:Ribonuclease R n=1 Tax=Parvularcula marina TaxID=2292771 RepID=A0A371RFM5_9PROT|nr:ribonuclease R [Parvularcula marina]RFB04243.1 ribonuclease R [Parvularcula marina]
MTNLPDPSDILTFIRETAERGSGSVTRKDIADAFTIKGADRRDLRALLKEMEDKGEIALEGRRIRVKASGGLPPVVVLDITGSDSEGDLVCVPVTGDAPECTHIRLPVGEAAKEKPPLGVGDRFLGRLKEDGDGGFLTKPIKRIGRGASRMLGIYRRGRRHGYVDPVSRKAGSSLDIHDADKGKAQDGDLVWTEPLNKRGYGPKRGRIVSVVGGMDEQKNWSLIALAENDIPIEFPDRVVAEAESQTLPDDKHYEDLTALPFITIDPKEAKDHDDAVFVEKTEKGWRLIVAIADVSWFVRPGTALDKEAEKRGNSVYLIDRVVPMLPEALSNGLCSLKAGEDRTSMCCEMLIAQSGRKHSHRFFRAKINCRAGLAYEEAQAAADGDVTDRTADLKENVIDPLWDVWRAMTKAREAKPSLDLDMPERQIVLGADGRVTGVRVKDRLEAHRLIETMMVAANVCAAETLEKARQPLIYRVHQEPDPERLEGLKTYLESMGYSLPDGQVLTPQAFNRILSKAREKDEIELVSMAILRTQMQAIYSTENQGHFGLNLARYAHFTSPIRRYADLVVHRAMVTGLGLGPGGARSEDEARLDSVAEHISGTERRAINAERSTQDRYLASYLEEEIGSEFPGRISGVTRAGLFVALDETGADGFVPMRTLRSDYFIHDEDARALIGQQTGARYHIGQRVHVRLEEVTPVQGGLRFLMLTEPDDSFAPPHKRKKSVKPGGKPKPHSKAHPSKTRKSTKPARRKDAGDATTHPKKKASAPHLEESLPGATIKRRPKKKKTTKSRKASPPRPRGKN